MIFLYFITLYPKNNRVLKTNNCLKTNLQNFNQIATSAYLLLVFSVSSLHCYATLYLKGSIPNLIQ